MSRGIPRNMVAPDLEGNVIWGRKRGEGSLSGAAWGLPCLAFAAALSLAGPLRAEEPVPPPPPPPKK